MSELVLVVEQVAKVIREEANVHTVFGEPIQLDGHTVVPIALLDIGLGGGGSVAGSLAAGGEDSLPGRAAKVMDAVRRRLPFAGGGGGLHVQVTPLGFLSTEQDKVVFRPLTEPAAPSSRKGLLQRLRARLVA